MGAYRDIDVEDLTKHKIDSEPIHITQEFCDNANRAKDRGSKICVVGTSTMRAIETVVSTDGHVKPRDGWTNKFIFPPYEFLFGDAMITNFNMPYSTLLMMTAAFGGYEKIMDAYQVAMKEKYRFGAYGDALLII